MFFGWILNKVGLEKTAHLIERGVDGIKILTATKSQKEIISFVKFAGLLLGYLGVANASFVENLEVDDLILISNIVLKYPFLKWSLLTISVGYLINMLFKIDCFIAFPKLILKLLKIVKDFIIGWVETLFDKDKTWVDFVNELFEKTSLEFKIKKIKREIKKLQDKIYELTDKNGIKDTANEVAILRTRIEEKRIYQQAHEEDLRKLKQDN
jgi:hypothetical protein